METFYRTALWEELVFFIWLAGVVETELKRWRVLIEVMTGRENGFLIWVEPYPTQRYKTYNHARLN